MALIRTFIAVELSSEVRSRATDLTNRLRVAQTRVTWVKPANMHLTLKFLGDVRDTELPSVCAAVAGAAATHHAFNLDCRGVGEFPSSHRPQTIWLGVDDGTEPITALHNAIDAALAKLGFAKERRRFQPHFTIGRVRDSGNLTELSQLLDEYADFDAGMSHVAEVLVLSSELSEEGPTHEVLSRTPLGRS